MPGIGLAMVLVCGGLIALVVWSITRLVRRGGCCSRSTTKQSPIDIVKERYAKGEITKEQFEQIKKDLS